MAEPRDGGIDTARALLLVIAFVAGTFVVLALAAALAMVRRDVGFGVAFEQTRMDPLVASLAQLVSAGVAIGLGVAFAFGGGEDVTYREALGVAPAKTATVVLSLTAGLALAFVLREIAVLVADLVPALAPSPRRAEQIARLIRVDDWKDGLIVPLAFVAVPALSEELFFRGLILPGLGRRMRVGAALLLSALLFGFVHLEPIAIVYGTLAGLALGWLRIRTDSVLPPIALHGAVNAMPILLPASLYRIEGFNTVDAAPTHLPATVVLGAAAIALGCFYGIAQISNDEV